MSDYTKGIFLLVLAVSGNFVAEILSCQTQKLLRSNMYVKHLVLLSILYFAINFSATNQAPFELAKKALTVWLGFLLFTKMHLRTTVLVYVMFCISYILSSQIDFYAANNQEEKIPKLQQYQESLTPMIIGTIVLGSLFYAQAKYEEYKGKFNPFTFLVGKLNCA